ncbi:STAS domain-containing protein [Dactylosporangium sp. NPDC000244]|uniref:STAS domain-containing protein n=1 Tax=Dactylosporangium sp. NPDC000244 TaxID=3154365 RepID=UPI00332634C0
MGMSIETRDVADGLAVSIAGELDVAVADAVRQTLDAALARRPEVLRVDLAKVRLLDSTIMTVLWRTQKVASAQNTRLVLRNPNEFVAHVLEVAGLLTVLRVEREYGGGAVTG